MKYVMDFERFKKIIDILQAFEKKQDKISKFFEEEIMEESYCMLTLGNDLKYTIINMLADEFDCWYSTGKGKPVHWWKTDKMFYTSNEIEWWLYESGTKEVTMGDVTYNLSSLGAFYDYLLENMYDKKHKGVETEFEEGGERQLSMEESLETLKALYSLEFDKNDKK